MKAALVLWLFGLGVTSLAVCAVSRKTCTKENLDIFIVVDSSRTINDKNFQRLRTFLSNLVGHFRVGKFQSRIGLMQFSEQLRTVIEFNFGEHETTRGIQDTIKKLVHQNGVTTYTGEALKMVNDKVFNGHKDEREDAERVLLLVTDGKPHDTDVALKEADELKKKGVHLITIGAGSDSWIENFKYELSRLGSKPTHNHRVKYEQLEKITPKLVQNICNSKKRQPAPPHKCFQEKQDYLILVDGSAGIGKRNFLKVKRFLQEFFSRLDIGPSRVHVGLIQYSETVKTTIEIALNQYVNVEDLAAAVAKVLYHEGSEADLAHALRIADLIVFNGKGGDRRTAPDAIVIFTDGNYKNKGSVLQLIRNLRNKNTRIVSVAVGGKHANQDNIDALALSSSDVYDMDVMDAVTFLDDMAPTTCKIATCTAAAPKCTPENQDVLILMDSKTRIDAKHFRIAQRFLQRLVSKMNLGKSQTNLGIMQYGRTGDVMPVASLGKHTLRGDVINAISMMKLKNDGYNSDLAYALKMASKKLLNPIDPNRQQVSKTIVIVTDGDMVDFTEANSIAENLRNRGVRILTLSNGKNSRREKYIFSLRLIASGPKEHYTLSNSYFNEVLRELKKTVCVSEPEIPDSCFTQKRNVFFALDSSGGRGKRKLAEVKSFLKTLLKKLHLGSSQTHIGFLQYDSPTSTQNRVVFDKADNADQILWRIQNMKYRRGRGSYLGRALRTINNEVFTDGINHHPGYKDVLIILSHKQISDAQVAFDEAEKLKNKGVEIISIATGSKKKVEEVKSQLRVISTSPTNVHSADYFSLWDVVDDTIVNICGLGKCPAFSATTCTPKKQDIVFAIDGSRSIGAINFHRLRRFTERLASRLDLAKDRTHLGLIQIGAKGNAKYQFNMGEFPDRDDALYMIKDMTYLDATTTYIGSGLRKIRTEMFNTSGPDRPSIDDTLLLFADGRAHDQKVMFEEAEKLKANGVKILSVGYGTNITLTNFKTNLIKMATNKKDTFIVDFKNNDLKLEEQIEVIAKHLVEVDCPRGYSAPVECAQGAIDLFLLVDGSRSINRNNFRIVKKFLKKLVSEFDIGVNGTHVGMIQFSDEESFSYEFGFNVPYDTRGAKRAIKRMKYKAGTKTLTGDALRTVNEQIFNHKNGDRPNVQDVLVLFTDGKAHDFELARRQAKEMKSRNIRIIAIAAGQEVKSRNAKLVKQLEDIASDPLDVYTAEFSELSDIVDKLIDIDCVVTQRDTSVTRP